jgi:hypothetical protein
MLPVKIVSIDAGCTDCGFKPEIKVGCTRAGLDYRMDLE